MLIEAGARVDAKALQYALREDRHLDTIRLLIEKGADLNARDEEGASPLDNAVWRGALDTIAILLAHGARLNESDTKTGATPINEAAYRGNASIVGYLLQFHPDLRISDKRGYIPLDNAIRMGKEDCALLLLEAEPKELLTPQFLGKTMEAAIQKNESDLVRALLGKGADPNLGGPNGASPLEDASLQGHAAIAAMLLDGGALVNRLDPVSGTTALYAAASFGKGEVVKLLLNRGANPTLCGKNRTSPYQAAVENGFSEVATIIREHGGSRSCEH
jgi:ankyrin repeat protein